MPNLNDICKEMIESIDYALAAAVVDQDSGLLLGVAHNVSYFSQTLLDTVAASAVELFRGKGVSTVENMLAELRNEAPKRQVMEIQMTTSDTFHFFTVIPDKPNLLAILIARKKVNLGMGWACLRSQLKTIAQLCP